MGKENRKSEIVRETRPGVFGDRFQPPPSDADLKLAGALAEDAQNFAEAGREQQKYAELARDLLHPSDDAYSGEIVRIAVWHYKRAAIGFRQSAVGYESAAKLEKQPAPRRRLLRKAEEMACLAEQTEQAVCQLSGAGEKNRGAASDETG